MEVVRDDDYIRLNLISDFIEDFVAPESKKRLYYLLSKPRRRHEIPGYFRGHGNEHLDLRYLHPVTTPPDPENIYTAMRKLGAPDRCFVLSMQDEYKDQVSLKVALEKFVGQRHGNILYCRGAKAGYWDSHGEESCILYKVKRKSG